MRYILKIVLYVANRTQVWAVFGSESARMLIDLAFLEIRIWSQCCEFGAGYGGIHNFLPDPEADPEKIIPDPWTWNKNETKLL